MVGCGLCSQIRCLHLSLLILSSNIFIGHETLVMTLLYLHLDMDFGSKGGAQSAHQLVTLKGKQLAITIEEHMICLSPLNEFLVESPSVDSTKEVVEVSDHQQNQGL